MRPSVLGGTGSTARSSSRARRRAAWRGCRRRRRAAAADAPREADGEVRHAWPRCRAGLPRAAVHDRHDGERRRPGVIAAMSLDPAGSSGGLRWQTLVAGVDIARAAAPRHNRLRARLRARGIAFDPIRMAVAGTPRAVLAPVATAHGRAHSRSLQTGSIVEAVTPAPASAARGSRRRWWSPSGFQPAAEKPAGCAARLSPDGTRLAGVNVEGAMRRRLGDATSSRGTATRLTHSGINSSPIWSADGRTVYFASRTDSGSRSGAATRKERQAAARSSSADAARHSSRWPSRRTARCSRSCRPRTGAGRTSGCCRLPAGRHARSWRGHSTTAPPHFRRTRRWSHSNRPKRDVGDLPAAPARRTASRGLDRRRRAASLDERRAVLPVSWALVHAAVADAAAFRVDGVTRVGDLQGGTLQGASPPKAGSSSREMRTSRRDPIVSLEWLREIRGAPRPSSHGPAALIVLEQEIRRSGDQDLLRDR